MALYGGYRVVAEHEGDTYHIMVKEGVRGMNIPVSATLINGKWHIHFQGRKLTVVEVTRLVPERKEPVSEKEESDEGLVTGAVIGAAVDGLGGALVGGLIGSLLDDD